MYGWKNKDIKAKFRNFNIPLISLEKDRFKSGNVVPKTWGEAIKLRVEKQGQFEKGGKSNFLTEVFMI